MSGAPAEGARLAGAFRRDLDSQQPALDRAVPDAVRAMRAQAQLLTELRRAGERRGVPNLEALAQHLTQLSVQRARALAVGEAHAVGRIGAEEPGPISLARRERRGLGQQPRLDAEGARAAERIEDLASARRELLPAGAQQHSRRHVLLELRFPARAAVAAAVLALAVEIERYRDGAALRVRMHPHARALERNVGPRAGGESQRIDDAVLELERPEVSVGDRGVPPAEIARQGGAGRQVRRPVELATRGLAGH